MRSLPNRIALQTAFLTCVILVLSATTANAQDKTRYWNLQWSWEKVNIEKLSNRLGSIGLPIPVAAEGQATVNVQVGIPLNALKSPNRYRLQGTISSPRLKVGDLVWNDLEAVIDVQQGVASLTSFNASVGTEETVSTEKSEPSGQVNGSVKLQFAPMGNLSADLNVHQVNIAPLHRLYQSLSGLSNPPPASSVSGTVNGRIRFDAPYQTINDITQWTLDADVQVEQFRSANVPVSDLVTGPVTIRDGMLVAKQMRLSMHAPNPTAGQKPSTLMLAAQAELIGRRRFQIGIVGDDVPLTEITALFSADATPWATGKLDIELAADGKLGDGKTGWAKPNDWVWHVDGKLASPHLSIAGLELGMLEHQLSINQTSFQLVPLVDTTNDRMSVHKIVADYVIGSDAITLNSLNANVFGGSANGTATIATNRQSNHQVDLHWKDLSFDFNTQWVSPVAARVHTQTSGDIVWSVPAAAVQQIAQHRGELKIQLQEIQISGSDVGEIRVAVQANPDSIGLQAEGNLLGGQLSIQTQADTTEGMTLGQLPQTNWTLAMAVSDLQADRVLAAIPDFQKPKLLRRRWQGSLSAKVDLQNSAAPDARVVMQSVLRNVSLDGEPLTRRLNLEATIVKNRIVIDKVVGMFADGRLDANGRFDLDFAKGSLQVGQASVRITSIDAQKLLRQLLPNLAKQIDGRLSARMVVTMGDRDRISVRGAVTLSNAVMFGMLIDEAHSQLSGWVTHRMDRFEFQMPAIAGGTGDGQFTGGVTCKSANRPSKVNLRSQWTLRRVNFVKTINGSKRASGALGNGRLSGKLVLNSNDVSSLRNLAGNFDFQLNGSGARSIPGLTDAQNFLGPIGLAGIEFDEGMARGVIGGGRASIHEFWLRSSQLMVWAEGAVTLSNLRLDLEAVLSTGNFDANSALISAVGLLAVDYATPIRVLQEINQLVNNRVIFVDVMGRASDPRLRLKPIDTLREEAAQFIVRQLVPFPVRLPQQQNPLAR